MLIDNNLKLGTLAERTSKQSGMPGTHNSVHTISNRANAF
jgi:hypothetical protein